MVRSLFYSITFHSIMILLTVLSLPFMLREPIDLPPIVSVELIQISDKTNIPYAPKARKIIEETKKKEDNNKLTQSNVKNTFATGLTLSEEDALRASSSDSDNPVAKLFLTLLCVNFLFSISSRALSSLALSIKAAI